jgi:alkanesulfonate monooxygenase SsuD/methylene tetrahydromethanopterin reductase-like flavin-dependent oxidoreductase (luciferase family)
MLQIVRRLSDGETVTFEGAHFQLARVRITQRPVQARVPVWIGGSNRAALRRAARFGDGIIGGGALSERYPDYVEELEKADKPDSTARMNQGGFTWFVVSGDSEKSLHEIAPPCAAFRQDLRMVEPGHYQQGPFGAAGYRSGRAEEKFNSQGGDA